MNEDNLIIGIAEDRLRQCEDNYMITCTDFLDMHQQSVLRGAFRQYLSRKEGIRARFYGGYPDAERTVMLFIPDYIELPEESAGASGDHAASDSAETDDPAYKGPDDVMKDICGDIFTVIRASHSEKASASRKGRALGHGDYLGALMGLGIRREVTGDILVRDDGADMIVLSEIADFIMKEYRSAGKARLELQKLKLDDLIVPESIYEEFSSPVASMRLDNIVSAGFGISRSKAAEAIRALFL